MKNKKKLWLTAANLTKKMPNEKQRKAAADYGKNHSNFK